MSFGDILSVVPLGETVLFLLFLHYQLVLQILDIFNIITPKFSLIHISIEIWLACYEII